MFRTAARVRRVTRRSTSSILLRLAGAVGIAGGLALAPAVADAGVGGPVAITGFSSSSTALQPLGGGITLTAVVTGASTCTYSVAPPVAGFPMTLSCAPSSGTSKRTQHVAVVLPPNAKSSAIHYLWSLVARPSSSGSAVKKTTTVTVEGYRWGATQHGLASPTSPTRISCPTTALCVLVATGGSAGTLDSTGAHWSHVDGTHSLVSVSCTPGTPVFCVAGDNAGNYVVLNGTTWSPPAAMPGAPGSGGTPDPVGQLTSMSCVRESPSKASLGKRCLAGDDTGHTYWMTFGSGVTIRPERHGIKRVAAASCASATACVVADLNGVGIYFDGKTWSAPTTLDSFGGVTDVSCAPDGSCVLTDHSGHVIQFPANGKLLTPKAVKLTKNQLLYLVGVSCVPHYCLVAVSDGSFFQSVGSAWAPTAASYPNLYGSKLVGASCALDKPTPLLMSCTAFTSGHKDFKGHVTLMK
jgi:hypothetical protein